MTDIRIIVPAAEPSSFSYTATHYVTAAAGGSGDGTEGDPWTSAQAMANAVAGDHVKFAPGTYNVVGTGNRTLPALRPANSGTAGNEIVFFTENRASLVSSGKSIIHGTGSGSLLGSNAANNIIFDGFRLEITDDASYTPISEGHLFSQWDADNVKALYLEFDADGYTETDSGTNWGFYYGQYVSNYELGYCKFTNKGGTAGNHACIMTYGASGYEIHHNTFDTCFGGFFPKSDWTGRDNTPGSFHHNLSLNQDGLAIYLGVVGTNLSGFLDIYQNVFDMNGADSAALILWSNLLGGSDHPANFRFVNNLFYNMVSGIAEPGGITANAALTTDLYENSVFQNNIFMLRSGNTLYGSESAGGSLATLAGQMIWDYNLYENVTNYFVIPGDASTTWSEWNTAGMDSNGIENSDPLLVDPTNDDFRLQDVSNGIGAGTSPALDAGQDILDLLGGGTSASINMGPYITTLQTDVIGVGS